MDKAFANVVVPFKETGLIKPEEQWENGVGIIEYHNVAGQFIFRRVRCKTQGTYRQKEFGIYTVGRGEGTLNGTAVKLGDTYLLAKDSEDIVVSGDMDLLIAGFRD